MKEVAILLMAIPVTLTYFGLIAIFVGLFSDGIKNFKNSRVLDLDLVVSSMGLMLLLGGGLFVASSI